MPQQARVLVVDDDDNIISAFEDFFRKEHCTMVCASNAKDALSIVSHQIVNLVITDIRMEWQSGVTLLMNIKQMRPSLPVIVITGYPNLISEADIKHYGAECLIVKPLELDQLRDAVRNSLNRAAESPH